MEYQVLTNVQVQQIPSEQFPDRNLLLFFSFLHKYEAQSTWEELTQTLCLVLPKNVKIKALRVSGKPYSVIPDIQTTYVQLGNINGQNSNLGGFDQPPVFLRGDLIKFNVGYRAVVNGGEQTYWTGQKGIPDLFNGIISAVFPKLPFTLHCEDWTWLLKQMPTPAKNWGRQTLQDIVTTILAASQDLPIVKRYKGYVNLTVSDFSKTDLQFNVGNLTTTRGSLAEFLARIKSQYRVDSYFRGQQLRIGYLHYDPADSPPPYNVFTFQKNILDNDRLLWQRRDDVTLSAIVRSTYLKETGGTTLDGQKKTTHATTEVLVIQEANNFTYIKKEKGKEYPAKYLQGIGRRFEFIIQDVITDPVKLFNIGKAQLEKYYYNGFKGGFTTFGIPYVKHGDTIQIVNKRLPEQSGYYKVKAVNYYGGFNDGLKQDILLDYKIPE